MSTETFDVWLTVAEAARRLKLSPQTVRRLVHSGQLPAYRASAVELRIDPAELEAYLRSRRVTGPTPVRGRRTGRRKAEA